MKNVLWIALLLLSLVACREDDEGMLRYENDGEAEVLLNGELWSPQIARAATEECFENRIGIVLEYYNDAGIRNKSLSIANIPLADARYVIQDLPLTGQSCSQDIVYGLFSLPIGDGDIVGDYYTPIKDANNYITITSYDTRKREIRGTFEISLAYNELEGYGRKVLDAPDTVRFTEGEFRIVLD